MVLDAFASYCVFKGKKSTLVDGVAPMTGVFGKWQTETYVAEAAVNVCFSRSYLNKTKESYKTKKNKLLELVN